MDHSGAFVSLLSLSKLEVRLVVKVRPQGVPLPSATGNATNSHPVQKVLLVELL